MWVTIKTRKIGAITVTDSLTPLRFMIIRKMMRAITTGSLSM
jgi:hypothetical protein